MKDFCLKDKIWHPVWHPKGFIEVEDFKEFIKILKKKEIIKKYGSIDIVKTGTVKIEDIDKLTGDLE